MIELDPADARRLALHAQGLSGSAPRDVPAMLRLLGAVQLDTISVLARSHELVAYARCGAVGRAAVERAYWGRPARAFEALAHAMCILPLEHWPLFAARRRRSARWTHPRRRPDATVLRAVLRELRARGSLTATDLGGSRSREVRPANVWWHWSAEKIALERLLAIGTVVCVERRGWRRVYDLAERAIPEGLRARDPDDATCHATLAALALDRLGVGTLDDIRSYFGGMTRDEAHAAVGRAALTGVRVRGWDAPAWASSRSLRALSSGSIPSPRRTTLLSPFDSLVWDRGRVARVFGFAHKLEAYTPPAERVHGYFAMPLLARGGLAGRVDPAREGTTLVAKRVSVTAGHARDMARALIEAARWVGCDDVRVGAVRPVAAGPALRTALRAMR